MSFYKYLKEHAEKDPSHLAIIDGDTYLSYGEFVSQIECFASALSKLKLNGNSKIGLLCPNQKEYLIVFFAALLIHISYLCSLQGKRTLFYLDHKHRPAH